jgi:hypothetical protein
MKKVLCESPRTHSADGYHDVRQKENRGDLEDLPYFQGMRRPYQDYTKDFTDHITPLIRYMWSCVGRPYDEVWSEICQTVPNGNLMDQHLLGHARDEIEINTYMVGDEVFCHGTSRYGSIRSKGLYVDPRDGIIRSSVEDRHSLYGYKDKTIYTWHRGYHYVKGEDGILRPATSPWRDPRTNHMTIKPLDDDTDALLLGGIWYMVTYAQVPPARIVAFIVDGETKRKIVPEQRMDAVLRTNVYSDDWYYVTKHQMTSNELRKHGLTND